MASKTNPTSLRLGLHRGHESLWTTKGSSGALVAQDRGLRLQIEAYLKALQCIPGQIVIRRSAHRLQIDSLYTKNALFEDTRPKSRRKNRERGRLPRQNRAHDQEHAQGFRLAAQRMKAFWAHSLFTGTPSGSVLVHSGRAHRELATLLLLGQQNQHTSFQATSAFYARIRVLSALSCLSDAEQGRMSLGYRATQTALHPALADRKDTRLRRLVTPPSTLSATHLFGYGGVQQAAGSSLSTENLHLQGLLSLAKEGKGFGSRAYQQTLQNRFDWIEKHCRTGPSRLISLPEKGTKAKTGLEITFGSRWKGLNPQSTEKTSLLHHTSFFLLTEKASPTLVSLEQGSSLSGPFARSLGRASGGASIRMLTRALEMYTGQRVDLRFHKAKDLLAHPDLLARGIALALEQRVSPRAIGSRLGTLYSRGSTSLSQEGSKPYGGSDVLLSNRLLGLRIRVSGPLGKQGGGKKQTIVKKFGSTPLSTLSAHIGYSQNLAYTKRGVVGVKVWVHTAPSQTVHQTNPFVQTVYPHSVPSTWTSLSTTHFVA
uniref:Ribosomal protein S3 n=1 Tax=Prasinoderma coloniale TaxID=156133 RepID=V9PA93_9VIRI|nr:ribosomal protein S3 [Prasinoderma coloniale]AGW52226.1 ribosomal protein S3 [Prasinoderma coloniale]